MLLASSRLTVMAMSRCCSALGDIVDHLADLCAPIGAVGTVDEDANRHMIFANPVDPPGEMILRAEGRLHEAFDDLAVGKYFFVIAAAPRYSRDLRTQVAKSRQQAKHHTMWLRSQTRFAGA